MSTSARHRFGFATLASQETILGRQFCFSRILSRRLLTLVLVFMTHPGFVCSQGIVSSNVSPVAAAKDSGRPFPVSFVDIASRMGLDMTFVQGDPKTKTFILEANGMGVAFIDYDNDGFSDIFLVNATRFANFAPGAEPTNHLYRNEEGKRFRDVTADSGVARSGWGNGVCRGDVDNDGFEDLYVTYWGANSLFHNKGSGRFEDIAAKAGVAGPDNEWNTGCTFLDFDRDGLLDLFVSSYVGFSPASTGLPGDNPSCMYKGQPVFCGPRGLPYGHSTLYRNKGNLIFEDVSEKSGIRKATPCYGFSATAADLNGDGWTDIYLACDSTPSLYFRNQRDGSFREIGTEAGLAFSEHGAEQAGMGIAVGDYNRDGWVDLTKTNFIRDYPNLFRNAGKGIFDDVAVGAGLGVKPFYVLWGVGFEDFDNDGFPDLFQVGAHVYPHLEAKDPSEPYAIPRLLFRNLGDGRFEFVSERAGPAMIEKHASNGAAFGDFDNDGDVDVLIMNQNEPPSLLQNSYSGDGRWIQLRLVGNRSNRSAIGATVRVSAGNTTQSSAILSQSSYLSVNDQRLHFGLGGAEKVDRVLVVWPSGTQENFGPFRANQIVELREGEGTRSAQQAAGESP